MNDVFWMMILVLAAFGVVGLCMAKKIRNGDSFYVMEEKAPTLFLVCGICMSYISAVTMNAAPGISYENGPFYLLNTAQPGAWFGTIVALLFIGRKMKAIGCYTIPDYFFKRFSDNNVLFLGILIMVMAIEIYGIGQLVTIGNILSSTCGISYGVIIVTFTVAIMFLCVPGGTWGIMMTDTIMFAVVLVTALVVCPLVIHGIYPEALAHLPEGFMASPFVKGGEGIGSTLSNAVLWFMFFAGSPVIITRVFPAKNDFAVFKATVISVALLAVISAILYFTAGLMRGVEPNLPNADLVMMEAFLNHVPRYLGLIGIAGILTAAISTASVLFCLAGFSVSRDLYSLLNPGSQEKLNAVCRARVAQVFAVALGGLIAYFQPASSYDLSTFACGILASSWLPTILLSLLWKRFNSSAAFYGMSVGTCTMLVLQALVSFQNISLPSWLNQYILSVLASLATSVLISLLRPLKGEDARRHYQIRHAMLSDSVFTAVRRSGRALPALCREYQRTKRIMVGTLLVSIVLWICLCIVFYLLI